MYSVYSPHCYKHIFKFETLAGNASHPQQKRKLDVRSFIQVLDRRIIPIFMLQMTTISGPNIILVIVVRIILSCLICL